MASMIPSSFIDDILERADIIDVISSRIELKKKGKDYWACCPFHGEKTASFSVNAQKQFYYCFGCGVSGTSLKFIQEFENQNFPEAVETLAKSIGLEVPRESNPELERVQKEKRTLTDLTIQVSDYYYAQLSDHADKQRAISYLKNRGLSGQVAKFFQIGYSPNAWDTLLKKFGTKEELVHQLLETGMLIKNDNGKIYDRFRDRIMFPIRDRRGNVLGFGGRVLGDEKPKYLNSPETPLFNKGKELYGLYETMKMCKNLERFVIVEGYMDVVALFQAGIPYAVATLGTATSKDHIQTLYKQVDELVFCFDGDKAGRRAALRALEHCVLQIKDGLQAKFLFLPEGEDPDSMVKKTGRDAFEQMLVGSQSMADFLIEHLQDQVDSQTIEGRAKLAKLAMPWLEKISAPIVKQLLVERLSTLVGVQLEVATPEPQTYQEYYPEDNFDGYQEMPQDYYAQEDVQSFDQPLNSGKKKKWKKNWQDNDESIIRPAMPMKLTLLDKIVATLIKHPNLVSEIELPEDVWNMPEASLLVKVFDSLRMNPQSDSYLAYDWLVQQEFGELIPNIASSDYFWLNSQTLVKQELEDNIFALIKKVPNETFEQLKSRVLARDPSLTDEEKTLYQQLLKQRLQR